MVDRVESTWRGSLLLRVTAMWLLMGAWWVPMAASAASAVSAAAVGDPPPPSDGGGDAVEWPEFPDAPPDAPEARLRVVFDLVTHETELAVEPHTPFDFWVVAHDVQVALRAWEAKILVDPRLLVLEREIEGLNVGKGDEVITALKPAACKSGVAMTLARYRVMLPEAGLTDLVLGLAPIERPSFDPPTPGYLVCRPGADLRTFAACDTCAVVNPLRVRPEAEPGAKNPLQEVLEPVRGRNGP